MSETLKRVLETVASSEEESPDELELLSFQFKDKDFLVTIKHVRGQIIQSTADKNRASKVEIKIYEKVERDKEVFHGEIFGVLSIPDRDGEYKMRTISAYNLNSNFISEDEVEKTGEHISSLITEAMRQLIISGIISEWSSAGLLSEGGNKIYEQLAKDPKLVVYRNSGIKKADGSLSYTYSVGLRERDVD